MRGYPNTEGKFWDLATPTVSGCWVWSGATYRGGYGRWRWKGLMVRAHRLAWQLRYGPIPAGLCVMHRCDNPPCVRPSHLRVGTVAENRADCVAKGRQAKGASNGTRTHPERVARGERNSQAKVTAAQVRDIRAKRAEGWTWRRLSRAFGITEGAVQFIVHRKTWRHLA